jgi:hypothetical protein
MFCEANTTIVVYFSRTPTSPTARSRLVSRPFGSLLAQSEEQLQGRLSEMLNKCLNDYFVSADAAIVIMARYLKGCTGQIRARKLDPNYLNLPGDSRLIAEALYFGFAILSNDVGDVHAMAAMAGLPVRGDSELERPTLTAGHRFA